jgi:hypothetical protein
MHPRVLKETAKNIAEPQRSQEKCQKYFLSICDVKVFLTFTFTEYGTVLTTISYLTAQMKKYEIQVHVDVHSQQVNTTYLSVRLQIINK